jgi:hypothetical protein
MLANGCASCFALLYDENPCVHRKRYLATLEYVISQGIVVEQPDRDDFAWKPADSFLYEQTRYIRISSVGYKHYGWDVMNSVLIHEFGHCVLFAEGIGEGTSWEDNLEIEKMANQRGLSVTPQHLVPERYQWHRDFFLKSYSGRGWNEETCLAEWGAYQQTANPI